MLHYVNTLIPSIIKHQTQHTKHTKQLGIQTRDPKMAKALNIIISVFTSPSKLEEKMMLGLNQEMIRFCICSLASTCADFLCFVKSGFQRNLFK